MRAKPIHTISLLASAIAMALPSMTFALGLGRLTVQSSLGQPLSAQIELTSASKDELDSLAAKIADPGLYRQNNLTYQGVLSRARVSVDRTQGGQAFLRVATTSPVNEPYLDLMVELNWSAGRVVREYTFLLDPPGVVAAAPAVEPVLPIRAGTNAPRSNAAPTRAASNDGGTLDARSGPGDGYTVRRGDSLVRIASQLKPDGVSLEQMLVALFRRNPDAFEGDNMNRLRSGSIMKVPSADEISGTGTPEATRVVRMQASDWRTYRDRVAAAAPTAAAGSRDTGGRITTKVEERIPAATPGGDQVRVSREAGQGKGAGAAAEDVVARDRALKDAQTRIAELEKTLKDLQRAVEMRNQTMAQLQTQADAGKGKAADVSKGPPGVAPAIGAASVASKAAESTTSLPAEASKSIPSSSSGSATNATARLADADKAALPSAATSSTTTATPTATPGATPATPVPVVPPVAKSEPVKGAAKSVKAEPAASTSMIDDLLTNPPSWAIGAGVLALIAGLVALLAARRRKTSNFEDSIISGTDIKSNTVFGSTGGGIVNTGENSLSSDFSREGMSTIDTDEVDPIAEAEVYLAYGRDAQAEEILKDALRKDPQRQEVYLKLLEIHAQHNKPSAFETVAADLFSVSHGQGETWHKAVALGRQLDPNNPLFAEDGSGAAAAAVAAAGAVAIAAAAAPSRQGPPSRAADVPPVPVGMAEMPRNHDMDFRLDEDISVSPASGNRPKSPADILKGAESELQNTAMHHPVENTGVGASALSIEQRIDAARGADPKFDLDFHLDESEKSASMRVDAPVRSTATAPSLARPQAAIDLDKLDLSFDPDRTTFEDPTPSVLDGQWHDAATKLDLAKAYQEMGDVEGAREILQEVLHEGDDQQKGEAGALLEKLG